MEYQFMTPPEVFYKLCLSQQEAGEFKENVLFTARFMVL
jgi:hypothetical protein